MLGLGKNNRGFTLLEVVVAMAIFTLIVVGVAAMFIYSWRTNRIIWEQLSTQNEGRKIIQDITHELRTAGASSIGSYAVATSSPQEIVFYTNIDEDTLRERVRYTLVGSILQKGVVKPTGTPLLYNLANETVTNVVHDVANGSDPLFYYYGQDYDGLATSTPLTQPVGVTEVRMVGIELKLEEDPTASPEPFHIESKIELRNLKSN